MLNRGICFMIADETCSAQLLGTSNTWSFPTKSTAFEQVNTIFVMALAVARTAGELRWTAAWTRSPQCGPGVFAVLAQGIELQIDLCQAIHIVIEITYHALQRIQRRLFRRHAVTHVLHDGVRSARANVLFPTSGGSRAAHVLV